MVEEEAAGVLSDAPVVPAHGSGRQTPVTWSQRSVGHVQADGQLIIYPAAPSPRMRPSPPPNSAGEEVVVLSSSDATQVVLYNAERKSLTLHSTEPAAHAISPFEQAFCPLCKQRRFHASGAGSSFRNFTAQGYFSLLGATVSAEDPSSSDNEANAAPQPPPKPAGLRSDYLNSGYYARFFEEERKIGSGGFGAVYLARHVLHGISLGQYAVKKVPVGDNHAWFVKVLMEVRALESLHHPNVVGYKHSWLETSRTADFGPEVPCLFILMDYANGGNLADYVQGKGGRDKRRILEDSEIWSLFIDICLGLRHLHHSAIIHRDLKAQNLLLHTTYDPVCNTAQTHVMISDFGQCQTAHSIRNTLKRTGNTGTVEYVAPELLVTDERGEFRTDYDDKSDVWSLGVILYLLCFSQLPFQSGDSEELVRLIVGASAPFPAAPKRPAGLLELVECLLRRDPAARPSIDAVLKLPEVERQMKRLKREELYPPAPPRPAPSPGAVRNPLAPSSSVSPGSLGHRRGPSRCAGRRLWASRRPAAPRRGAGRLGLVGRPRRRLHARPPPLPAGPAPHAPGRRPLPGPRPPAAPPALAPLLPLLLGLAGPGPAGGGRPALLPRAGPTLAPARLLLQQRSGLARPAPLHRRRRPRRTPLGPEEAVAAERATVVGGLQIRRIPSDAVIDDAASDAPPGPRRRLEVLEEGEGGGGSPPGAPASPAAAARRPPALRCRPRLAVGAGGEAAALGVGGPGEGAGRCWARRGRGRRSSRRCSWPRWRSAWSLPLERRRRRPRRRLRGGPGGSAAGVGHAAALFAAAAALHLMPVLLAAPRRGGEAPALPAPSETPALPPASPGTGLPPGPRSEKPSPF
eukprot:tig00020960_g16528.t1